MMSLVGAEMGGFTHSHTRDVNGDAQEASDGPSLVLELSLAFSL
jgi:hypothetical protein